MVEESLDVFESLEECVQDARRHGYAVRRAPLMQPHITPPHVETKAAIAA